MKRDRVIKKLEFHKETKTYTKIIRQVAKGSTAFSHGYILDYSTDFLLLHETDDFRLEAYHIIPIDQIKKVRFNEWDKCYDNIMKAEKETENIGIDYTIDLSNWKSIFKSIKANDFYVIIECEASYQNSFNIGPIVKAKKAEVLIHNFDPAGYFDDEPTSIDYTKITKIQFNDRYIDIFRKYTKYKEQ